jgi:hypothetical protein
MAASFEFVMKTPRIIPPTRQRSCGLSIDALLSVTRNYYRKLREIDGQSPDLVPIVIVLNHTLGIVWDTVWNQFPEYAARTDMHKPKTITHRKTTDSLLNQFVLTVRLLSKCCATILVSTIDELNDIKNGSSYSPVFMLERQLTELAAKLQFQPPPETNQGVVTGLPSRDLANIFTPLVGTLQQLLLSIKTIDILKTRSDFARGYIMPTDNDEIKVTKKRSNTNRTGMTRNQTVSAMRVYTAPGSGHRRAESQPQIANLPESVVPTNQPTLESISASTPLGRVSNPIKTLPDA